MEYSRVSMRKQPADHGNALLKGPQGDRPQLRWPERFWRPETDGSRVSGDGTDKIALAYGNRQTFRYRCEDIQILGSTSLTLPTKRSEWRLNGGPPVHFYVERQVTAADPPQYPWKT